MQAKDLDTRRVLRVVRDLSMEFYAPWEPGTQLPHWVNRWTLRERMPEVPEKVLLAKLRGLIGKNLLSGCACGCRADLELTELGAQVLKGE